MSKSKVTEPPVVPQSSSKLSNRLGPPKEISFSDLVPVKRSSAAEVYDSLTPPRESTEFDESSASRRVHLSAAAFMQSDDGSTRSAEYRQKPGSCQSAFERLDKTGVSSASGHRAVSTKVCTVSCFADRVTDLKYIYKSMLQALSSSDVRKTLGDSPPSQSTIANRRERFNLDSDRIEDRNTRSGKRSALGDIVIHIM